jgi:hypothetical protein
MGFNLNRAYLYKVVSTATSCQTMHYICSSNERVGKLNSGKFNLNPQCTMPNCIIIFLSKSLIFIIIVVVGVVVVVVVVVIIIIIIIAIIIIVIVVVIVIVLLLLLLLCCFYYYYCYVYAIIGVIFSIVAIITANSY